MLGQVGTRRTCSACPGSGCSSITLMNEQPSKSGLRNHSSNTSKIASSCSLRIRAALLDLGLKPIPGPELLAALQERHHEVLLGGEVAVHRLAGDARSLDDRVDADRLDAPRENSS